MNTDVGSSTYTPQTSAADRCAARATYRRHARLARPRHRAVRAGLRRRAAHHVDDLLALGVVRARDGPLRRGRAARVREQREEGPFRDGELGGFAGRVERADVDDERLVLFVAREPEPAS